MSLSFPSIETKHTLLNLIDKVDYIDFISHLVLCPRLRVHLRHECYVLDFVLILTMSFLD